MRRLSSSRESLCNFRLYLTDDSERSDLIAGFFVRLNERIDLTTRTFQIGDEVRQLLLAEIRQFVRTASWTLAFFIPIRLQPTIRFHITQRPVDQTRIQRSLGKAVILQFGKQGIPMPFFMAQQHQEAGSQETLNASSPAPVSFSPAVISMFSISSMLSSIMCMYSVHGRNYSLLLTVCQ